MTDIDNLIERLETPELTGGLLSEAAQALRELDYGHGRLMEENTTLRNALRELRDRLNQSDEPTVSFRDFNWGCGHTGPAVCAQCWNEKLAENEKLRAPPLS